LSRPISRFMSILDAILLGTLQGVTEFLPVSSSGHLAAVQVLLGVETPGVFVEVCLHFGTLMAILLVFRRELVRLVRDGFRGLGLMLRGERHRIPERAAAFQMCVALLVGSVPAAVAGILIGRTIERFSEGNLPACGVFLFVTGLALLASRYAPPGCAKTVSPARGLLIGLAQAVALLPGISRSGSTIVTGLFLKLERETAVRFAFLLAVPAIAGAMLWELVGGKALEALPASVWLPLMVGTLLSALVGTVCLLFLVSVIRNGRLHLFAAYCLPAGVVFFVVGILR